MRGGFPYTFAGRRARTTLHLYSRKHGDLERDYNDFCVMPTPYSQGNGNFRDINQNRRCDLLFNPDIREGNVEYFYNLIQLDGFNPLVLREISFRIDDGDQAYTVLEKFMEPDHLRTVRAHLDEPFTPGALLQFLHTQNIAIAGDSEAFLGQLLDHCSRVPETDHGEGYWTDHWTYCLDLLENYRAVYPDRFHDLLYGAHKFTFHDSAYRVQPRDRKYVLRDGKPAQLGAVVFDDAKAAAIEQRDRHPHQVRADGGKGDVYRTSLFTKVLCLIVNKLASLDPEGVGVEMEAGKPNWYDALNGLPGLFGSSISETLEIKRHIMFLLEQLPDAGTRHEEVAVFQELHEFMVALQDILAGGPSPFEFWDRASGAKERFRAQTRMGIGGHEIMVKTSAIRSFFTTALAKLDEGIAKARDGESNTLYTYFRHEVTDYERIEMARSEKENHPEDDANGWVHIRPLHFRQVSLPLFLEGPVHYLRCKPGEETAREFAAHIKASALFDESLKLYKVNASLVNQPMDIGRAKVFSPGWLENESIWLHMEYKYLLELLRNGLYAEFYEDFKNACIPFMNPEVYGRSILENCSFIASSAHPDSSVHGNGFVARLSGATAEFIHMLLLMVMGPRPFRTDPKGELRLCLEPALPAWLFTRDARNVRRSNADGWREVELPGQTFSFMFLGSILVVYHNPERRDTYGKTGAKPAEWIVTDLHGSTQAFEGETLSGDAAVAIRNRKIDRIDVQLR
jgi:hypothetical protein